MYVFDAGRYFLFLLYKVPSLLLIKLIKYLFHSHIFTLISVIDKQLHFFKGFSNFTASDCFTLIWSKFNTSECFNQLYI